MEMQTELSRKPAFVAPEIGGYTDYRAFLKDFFNYKIEQHKNSYGGYSYKTFSAAADIKSPNYLKMVIDGERNLSPVTIKKFARAMQLSKDETDEFGLLVLFNQATDPLDRNRHLKNLSEYRMRKRVRSGEVSEETLENSPSWVAWVLHALADRANTSFSVPELHDLLLGRVKNDEIERILKQLIEAGALTRDEQSGEVKKGLKAPPNWEDIPAEVIRKLQAELIYLGMESLIQGRAEDREFGTLTVCLTEAEYEKLKFELRHLRKRIYKDALIARAAGKGEKVYQFNLQLFPITK
jgi:uncharacterized protein (TIGR02147 family)